MKKVQLLGVIAVSALLISSVTLYPQKKSWTVDSGNKIEVIRDNTVYDVDKHTAFTTLESYKGHLYLAFREAEHHLSTSDDKGVITILKETKGKWKKHQTLSFPNADLRDPFLLKWKGRLILYTVGAYSELLDQGWTPLVNLKHNAKHPLNIWKMREYKGVLYGVGNAGGEWPILLSSKDGINWDVIQEFKLGGNASEADLCFIGDTVYICIRVDEPVGSMSLWGTGTYPFNDINWNVMNVSVASPELMAISDDLMLLSGREYNLHSEEGADGIYVSVFTINKRGMVMDRIHTDVEQWGDKGYPSFCFNNGRYYMSYYSGFDHTKIKLLEFKLK